MTPLLTLEWLAWGKGLATSAGLIVAIGAQNAFLLTQSLKRQFHWPIALLCILFDALMISAGVAGLGVLINQSPLLLEVARWGGALFLLWFGLNAARRALGHNSLAANGRGIRNLRSALITTTAVTLLNPHAWIDTVVLLGSIGGQYRRRSGSGSPWAPSASPPSGSSASASVPAGWNPCSAGLRPGEYWTA